MVAFAEEYRRLTLSNCLSLFDTDIANRLVKIQKHVDALRVLNKPSANALIQELLARATELKLSVVKPDPFEGRCVCATFEDKRTNYTTGVRGRPKLPAVATVKRKRGRPRKQIEPYIPAVETTVGFFNGTHEVDSFQRATAA